MGANDSSAVPAAYLTLEQQRSHRRAISADSAGTFLLDSLSPGRYELITQAIGFGVRRDTVELHAAGASILLIPLTPIPRWECASPLGMGFAGRRSDSTPNPHRRAAT